MRLSEVFRFRLTPEESERLDKQAEAKGLSKADLIRDALGWELTRAPAKTPSKATQDLFAPVETETPADPSLEPGKAAIEQLASRLHAKEGLPKRAAEREAKNRLSN